jgi:hypothetical protein
MMPLTANDTLSPEPTDRRIVWFAFAGFIVLTGLLAMNHVMWRDEVRAFSVAIHSPSWAQLVRDLHTEGHPIVWYAVLRIAYGVTHSVLVLPLVALAFGIGAAFLVLRYAPFPIWERLLIVFGAFLAYQFSVLARNYGVAIMLMMLACILFQKRDQRPLRLGLTLAVMANTSVHAAAAAFVLAFLWSLDFFDPTRRASLLRAGSLASLAIVLLGVVIAIVSARPSPDMAFAANLDTISAGTLLRKILKDPGASLVGSSNADVAAVGDLPWGRIGIDPAWVSRIYVDLAFVWLVWSLRKSWKSLVTLFVAVVAFSVLFRNVYTPGLRHEGLLAFLLISICWIACNEGQTGVARRRIAYGLIPILVTQALTLVVLIRRPFIHPESSAREYAAFIQSKPEYRNAILMSEPDFMMETMPYYVTNPVYMPRQREFHYRVYWDRGPRRQQDLSLGQLVNIADSVGCANSRPVLLAITYRQVITDTAGSTRLPYRPAIFRWNQTDRALLMSRSRRVMSFLAAADEDYYIFEFPVRKTPACRTTG